MVGVRPPGFWSCNIGVMSIVMDQYYHIMSIVLDRCATLVFGAFVALVWIARRAAAIATQTGLPLV